MNNRIHQTIRLARGSRHLVPVESDARILVKRGLINLRPPPEWPADTFFQTSWRLNAEQCHVTAARGYLELTAMEDAEVLIIPPEPFFPSLGEVIAWIERPIQWLLRRLRTQRQAPRRP